MKHPKTTTHFLTLCICLLSFFLIACKDSNKTIDPSNFFEGEIRLSESRGLYGAIFKVNTHFYFSEKILKREQRLGGVNQVFNNYAGLIVDLTKDSVTLYYGDLLSQTKIKHLMSIAEYKALLDTAILSSSVPSPFDHTFKTLPTYKFEKQVKDSSYIKDYLCDYILFKDSMNIFKQEIYDTKEIKVNRKILELVFLDIPQRINFPLKSYFKSTLTDISSDSIIASKQSKAIVKLINKMTIKNDSLKAEKEDTSFLNKLSQNTFLKKTLDIVKWGIDLNFHIKNEISIISTTPIESSLWYGSLDLFNPIDDINVFLGQLPSSHGSDWDD